MVLADLRRDGQVGTQERGAKLGDQFFHRVAVVAPFRAAEVAIETEISPRRAPSVKRRVGLKEEAEQDLVVVLQWFYEQSVIAAAVNGSPN